MFVKSKEMAKKMHDLVKRGLEKAIIAFQLFCYTVLKDI